MQNPIDCLHYAINLATDVVITGIDKPAILDQAFQAAKTFQVDELLAILSADTNTQQLASTGLSKLLKSFAHFDRIARHSDWLGGDSPAVQPRPSQQAG